MASVRFKPRTARLVDLVNEAFSELESLAGECREIVDNASEGLSQTQRIQTFEETANILEGLCEPEVNKSIEDTQVTYSSMESSRKGRGLSRANRCSEAVNSLNAVVEALEQLPETDETSNLKNELEEAANEAEGCELPGMYG